MKFYKILITLSLFFSINSFSQENYEDVIYLKNQNIIHGMIIEQIPNESIKIKTKDKDVFYFKISEIEKIVKEVNTNYDEKSKKNIVLSKYRFFNITEFVYGFSDKVIGLQTINGVTLGESISLGIGIGYDKYPDIGLSPIFLDFRYFITKNKISPFIELPIGQSFIIDYYARDGNEGNLSGFYTNPSMGIKFKISPNTAFNLSLGFKYQKSKEYLSYKNVNLDHWENREFGYINFKTGFSF